MQDSIFTRIIKGELPSAKIYEDDLVIAFMALHAVRAGHTLVVPKEQIDHFHHLDETTLAHIMKVAKKISLSLEKTYKPDRVGMAVIGYEVPHAHLHLIPLHDVNDLTSKKILDGTLEAASGEELQAEAEKIVGNL